MSSLPGMFSHPFIAHAFLAGTAVAVLCGLAGYFLVQRGEVFAGDALGHVAYTGAMAALAAGMNLRLGLFVAAIVAGAALGLGGIRGGTDDVAIGSFFSWTLGLGVLFLTYYTTHRSTGNGAANANILFGSIFGINAAAASIAAVIAAVTIGVLLVISRPLLFATIDPAVARATGVPARVLGAVFLAIVGTTVAEATPLVGSVVVLGLLAAPAAAAARLTDRPWTAFWLSAALSTLAVWAGIVLSYEIPAAPASFTIIAVAASGYLAAFLFDRFRRHREHATTAPSLT
ncbi:metal ABC transporter permease [Nocardia pseudobrasiliensis]|uniref:Zinc/manganese transport system permease protein n=1 Tax=Nocardia pseudobrasiliensis TaxID=45979 RepID=A0A370HS18_9NOCA|nr:metal ABC transporter permease [Nocardia pseudobrasiliensis]RDI61326.1 zinc/manganese transport system permease protein [Nocardia pseudobrasiliensis]